MLLIVATPRIYEPMNNPVHQIDNKLVAAEGLLAALFDEAARPSLRWLRGQQKRRTIPFVKVGRFVRFDPVRVRACLDSKFTVMERKSSEGAVA